MKLSYITFPSGSPDEKKLSPILFIHLFCMSKHHWRVVGPDIAKQTGRLAYAVDLRDHGDSGWSDHFCPIKCAEDIEEFMDDHLIKKAILVGHANGVDTALNVAFRRPDRIEMLILEEPSPFVPGLDLPEIYLLMINIVKAAVEMIPPDVSEDEARLLLLLYGMSLDVTGRADSKNQNKRHTKMFVPIRRRSDRLWELSSNCDILEKSITHPCDCKNCEKRKYEGPTAFICGPNMESFSLEHQKLMKENLTNASVIKLAKYHPLIHQYFFKEFADIVAEFINTNSSRKLHFKKSKY